jgi:hypothetical protein
LNVRNASLYGTGHCEVLLHLVPFGTVKKWVFKREREFENGLGGVLLLSYSYGSTVKDVTMAGHVSGMAEIT